jgi:outer membrane protein assembly factor BamB
VTRWGLCLALLAGCATEAAFSPHFRDNNADDLHTVLSKLSQGAPSGVSNSTGKPMAFVVTTAPKKLIAVDLASGQQAWAQDADVSSRVTVGKDVVVAREGDALVARDVRSGAVAWRSHLEGKLVGVAYDAGRFYYVAHGAEGRRSGMLVALDEHGGSQKWHREAQGSLGAPAARSGLVFLPFMSQWLAVLDGSSSDELARIRSTEEQINFARALPEGVYYGSAGVFALTDKAAAGSRKESSYAVAKFPGDFIRPVYGFDGYSPAQADYSAVDRNRVLWRGAGGSEMAFGGNQTVLHTYRFFFGVDSKSGSLHWAYDHPRVDVVSAELAGRAIFLCAQDGVLEAIDSQSGARLWQGSAGQGVRVAGATFDAEGFVPQGNIAQPPALATTLVHIVWDNDRRFGAVKLFAIETLSKLQGPEVTGALVKILTHEGMGPQIYAKAGEALIARKDKDAAPTLAAELRKRYSYVDDVKPTGTEMLAQAIATSGATDQWQALADKLRDPATPPHAIRAIAVALKDLGAKQATGALREYLLMYRSDPGFAADPAPLEAVAEAIGTLGGARDREVLKYVAEEPRTLDKLATYIRKELEQTGKGKATAEVKKEGAKPAAAQEEPKQ